MMSISVLHSVHVVAEVTFQLLGDHPTFHKSTESTLGGRG